MVPIISSKLPITATGFFVYFDTILVMVAGML